MSLRNEPLVTVLTPVYNGEAFLKNCIESVLTQTYQNYEYIIINNCSTDRTLEIAQEYAKKDNRIRVQDNTAFVGVIENHNLAFELMSPLSKYCKVVSADDFIFPECIARMVQLAEENPSVGLVGSYQLSGKYVKWQGFQYPKQVFSGKEICRQLFFTQQVFIGGQPIFGFGTPTSILYRADLIRANRGKFYPNSSPHADTSACFKNLNTWDFGFVYEILCYEQTHEETQSSKSKKINRYLSAMLNDVIEYGRLYLSPEELRVQLKSSLRDYHEFLAISYLMGSRDREFWTYHKSRLAELGYPVRPFTLVKAGVGKIVRELLNPEQAIRKLLKRYAPNQNKLSVNVA